MRQHLKYSTVVSRFLVLTLFLFYYWSNTAFYHTHRVDGRVVIHSHFYASHKGGPGSNEHHPHAPGDFTLIQSLNLSVWTAPSLLPGDVAVYKVPARQTVWETTPGNVTTCTRSLSLRAPPVLLPA